MGRLVRTGQVEHSVFVSYSHADAQDRDDFLMFLVPLCERLGHWPIWVDRDDLRGGDLWRPEIGDAIERSDVFIVLMSQQYRKSPNCMDKELQLILEKVRRGQARVIGIALHSLTLEDFSRTLEDGTALGFDDLQCLPQARGVSGDPGREGLKPLNQWHDRRDGWHAVQVQMQAALTSTRSGVQSRPVRTAEPSGGTSGAGDVVRTDSALPLAVPFLCDRQRQVTLLVREARGWHGRQCCRPLLLISEGHYDDSLTEWVDRLALFELTDALPVSADERAELKFADPRTIEWPDLAENVADAGDSLVQALGKRLNLGRHADLSAIHREQADRKMPVMWWTEVPADQPAESALFGLEALLGVLEGWPALTLRTMLVVSVHLLAGEAGGPAPLRDTFGPRLDAAARQGRVQVVQLGRLPLILPRDLTSWADDDRVRPHLPADVQTLRDRLGPQGLPMWPFVKQFNQWVDAHAPGRPGDPSRGSIR